MGRRRSRQVVSVPSAIGWITGPPDAAGMVEVGYAVDPLRRRQGYARAALAALLERAEREPSVRIVRATIRPDNTASRLLVLQYGFVEVGEQWDEEDGLETIFEVSANPGR